MFIKNGSFKKYTHIISYVPPSIIQQPVGGIGKSGEVFTFSIKAKGSEPMQYQWFKDSYAIPDENTNELILTNLELENQGYYYCSIGNKSYSIDSNLVQLIVQEAPSIVSQTGTSYVTNLGNSLNFGVEAAGSPFLAYQWYKNGEKYYGTAKDLYFKQINSTDAATYFVVVTNSIGSVSSENIQLTIREPISIVINPQSTLALNVGQNAQLVTTYRSSFTSTVTAKWFKDNVRYGNPIKTQSEQINLNINNVQKTDKGNYYCVIDSIVNSVTSTKCNLYVNLSVGITQQPPSFYEARLKERTTISLETSGSAPIQYQWIKKGYGPLLNYNNKVLKFDPTEKVDEGYYACITSNILNTITSTFVQLSVITNLYFVKIPSAYTLDVGDTVTFEVSAIGPEPSFKYAWTLDSIRIPNKDTRLLYIPSIDPADDGIYSCIIDSSVGSITSLGARLSVTTDILMLSDGSYLTIDGSEYLVL